MGSPAVFVFEQKLDQDEVLVQGLGIEGEWAHNVRVPYGEIVNSEL
jgi:hypothetical protein